LKVSGINQFLVYADDGNILGGSVCTVRENTESLVVTSRETGLEVNADETKYMVMFRDQNAGRSRNRETDNRSFEMVEVSYYCRVLNHDSSVVKPIIYSLTVY
jgi:hypothetical protein